ncbi:hypothetical protein SNEBB_010816 [Seison nebaliae]|nr:hypothetical protein SNEBB_010816 [Seison nebaliae]
MVKTDDPQVGRHVDVYVEMASMPLALWLVFSALFISILAIILMLMMWYKLRRGRKQNLDKPLRNFSGIPVDPASYEKVDSAPADDYSQSAIYQAPYVKSAIIPQEDSRGKKLFFKTVSQDDTYRDASNSPLYSNPFSSTATPRHYYSEPDLTINYNRPKSAAKMVASSLMETIRSSSSLYGGTLTTAISPDSKNNA